MLKKFYQERFFNWTASDVTGWEKIRANGWLRFTLWYGLALFGGVLFVLIGGFITLLAWLQGQLPSLIPQLVVIALICLLGGLICGLLTWIMEEKLYTKFKKIHSQGKPSDER